MVDEFKCLICRIDLQNKIYTVHPCETTTAKIYLTISVKVTIYLINYAWPHFQSRYEVNVMIPGVLFLSFIKNFEEFKRIFIISSWLHLKYYHYYQIKHSLKLVFSIEMIVLRTYLFRLSVPPFWTNSCIFWCSASHSPKTQWIMWE